MYHCHDPFHFITGGLGSQFESCYTSIKAYSMLYLGVFFHLFMPLFRNTFLQIYVAATYLSLYNYLFGEQMMIVDLLTTWLNSAFYSGITYLFNNATWGFTCLFTELWVWNYLSLGQTLFCFGYPLMKHILYFYSAMYWTVTCFDPLWCCFAKLIFQ